MMEVPMDEFERLRLARRKASQEKRDATIDALRTERARSMQTWLDSGKSALANVCRGLNRVATYINPHATKKLVLKELIDNSSRVFDVTSACLERDFFYASTFATRLLNVSSFRMRRKLICQKSRLILWKFEMLKELRNRMRKPGDFSSCQIPHHRVLQLQYSIHRHNVIVDKIILNDHKKLILGKRNASIQLEKVLDAIESNNKIFRCNVPLHYEATGCPTCGVIHIGASSSLQQFVKRIHRETGLETLISLPFEMEALSQERIDALAAVKKSSTSLHEFEAVLHFNVRSSIQAWWVVISALRRATKTHSRVQSTLYFFRIRRLVLLKRDVDNHFREHLRELSPDMTKIFAAYTDLTVECEEYSSLLSNQKKVRVMKQAVIFNEKLRLAVAKARQRNFRVMERLRKEEKMMEDHVLVARKSKQLREMRTRIRLLDARRFVCIRPQCNYRQFISQDRYDTHMRQHIFEDAETAKRRTEVASSLCTRTDMECQMKRRISLSRASLFQVAPSYAFSGIQSHSSHLPVDGVGLLASGVVMSAAHVVYREKSQFKQLDTKGLTSQGSASDPLFKSVQLQKLPWMQNPHHMHKIVNHSVTDLCHLKLLSKQNDVSLTACPNPIPLDVPVLKIGSSDACECPVAITGIVNRDNRISKIHCMIYSSPYASRSKGASVATIVDNHTIWGTYVVNASGAFKVPSKITVGMPVGLGDLICIGVLPDGPNILEVTDANGACLVFQVCCSSLELGSTN